MELKPAKNIRVFHKAHKLTHEQMADFLKLSVGLLPIWKELCHEE